MLLINDHIVENNNKKQFSCFQDLELAKKRGEILNVISLSTLFWVENMVAYIKASVNSLNDINKYLRYGNKRWLEINNIEKIAKNLKKWDNIINIPQWLNKEDFKTELILKLNKQQTNWFWYIKEMLPFLVGIFVDIITIPTGVETISGAILSVNNIRQKKEINKLSKNINKLEIVENNMKKYAEWLQNLVWNNEINNNHYYELNTYFDALFNIINDSISLNNIKQIKEISKINYKLIQNKLKKSNYESFFKNMDITYIDSETFIKNVKELFKNEISKDLKWVPWNNPEILDEILEIINQEDFSVLLDKWLSASDPLPELDWNLILRNIWAKEYPKFMHFLDNYLIFRFAFFTTKQVERILNSINITFKGLREKTVRKV